MKRRLTQLVGLLLLGGLVSTGHTEGTPTPDVDYEMIFVPGGEFVMGSEKYDNASPHAVRVSGFELSATEVTVADWRRFTEDQRIPFDWHSFNFTQWIGRPSGYDIPREYAMYFIIWYEAVWFANWLSELHDLTPAYRMDLDVAREYLYGPYDPNDPRPEVRWNREADGFRLPTEAEWEYAATDRGRIRELSEERILAMSWIRENSDDRVRAPAQKKPLPLGHYDMLGNVAEWVWDHYSAEYFDYSPVHDPAGPDFGQSPYLPDRSDIHVFRGCSWRFPVEICDVRFRGHSLAVQRSSMGLRLARNAP